MSLKDFNVNTGFTRGGQINLQGVIGGNYVTDADLAQKITVHQEYLNVNTAPGIASEFLLSTAILGLVGKRIATIVNTQANTRGIIAATIPAIGVPSTQTLLNSAGQVVNIARVVDAGSQKPVEFDSLILDGTGSTMRVVYALIQCDGTVVDNDLVGAFGAENLQLTFVYYNEDGQTFSLASCQQSFDLIIPTAVSMNQEVMMENGTLFSNMPNFIAPAPLVLTTEEVVFEITSEFDVAESIDIITGTGGITGTSAVDVGTIPLVSLGTTNALFVYDSNLDIYLNGIKQTKRGGLPAITWLSNTSFRINNTKMYVGDVLEIKRTTLI